MPAEKFYYTGQVEGDEQDPDITIGWNGETVTLNEITIATADDASGLDRMIRALKRARRSLGDVAGP